MKWILMIISIINGFKNKVKNDKKVFGWYLKGRKLKYIYKPTPKSFPPGGLFSFQILTNGHRFSQNMYD